MTALGVSAAVDAAPSATSTTSVDCGLELPYRSRTIGPLTVAGEDSCDSAASTALGSYVAVSNVKTGFGPALPKVGVVEAAASVNATGTDEEGRGTYLGGEAEAGGSVTFYFTVKEDRAPPGTYVPPKIYFEANGYATLEGFATNNADYNYEGSAGALAILPDGSQWGIEGEISDPESSSWSDEFAKSINLDLAPNDPANPFYQVTIGAGCYVGAWTGAVYTSRAGCRAFVDPTVRLGQEAFDAQYGADSFPLSEYYTLTFSENVLPVPVKVSLEEPLHGEIHSGIGNLRGWAIAENGIEKVEIYIDGKYMYDAPFGGERTDVGAQYPDIPGSDTSGFSLAFGYSNLGVGQHRVTARAFNNLGEFVDSSANFEVVAFHKNFINKSDIVDTSKASMTATGDEILLDNVSVDGQPYELRLKWRTAEQGFEIIEIR